jgi:hypothetical protein
MSLLDKLRGIENFPASHQPATGELLSVVGALIALLEHGDELFEAVKADVKAREAGEPAGHVDQLVSGVEPEPEPAPVAAQLEDPQVRIAQLQQELETARAQAQRTQTSVTPAAAAAAAGPLAPPAAPATTNPEGV